ncbi:hypothetical protein Vretimale_10633, partial [Volvox reticuliferus]
RTVGKLCFNRNSGVRGRSSSEAGRIIEVMENGLLRVMYDCQADAVIGRTVAEEGAKQAADDAARPVKRVKRQCINGKGTDPSKVVVLPVPPQLARHPPGNLAAVNQAVVVCSGQRARTTGVLVATSETHATIRVSDVPDGALQPGSGNGETIRVHRTNVHMLSPASCKSPLIRCLR